MGQSPLTPNPGFQTGISPIGMPQGQTPLGNLPTGQNPAPFGQTGNLGMQNPLAGVQIG